MVIPALHFGWSYGTSGHVGSFAMVLPKINKSQIGSTEWLYPEPLGITPQLFQAPFQGYELHQGSFALVLPVLDVVASGTERYITPLRRGLAMNLVNWAVTEYSNVPFNSMAVYQGQQLAATEWGIYLIEGSDDDGTPIMAYMQTGVEDLYRGFLNRLREAVILSRQDGQLNFKILDDKDNLLASILISAYDGIISEKITGSLPRALKNRYVSFWLENVGGSDFDLEGIKVFLEPKDRKR
jgi:hypothetical protein